MLALTREIAYAASMDAANRSMRKANRTSWNADDYNVACAEFNRLWSAERDSVPFCSFDSTRELTAGKYRATVTDKGRRMTIWRAR